MPTDDSNSPASADGNPDGPLPPRPAPRSKAPTFPSENPAPEEEDETPLIRTALSPALRLMAWMVAGVVLLGILAWTLRPSL
jgi:hypothetical protein